MSRRIVITSGKGGVGKTSVTANLGMKLSRTHRVIVMDTDIGLNNLDVALGVENRVVYDLVDCIEGRCRIKQALIEVPEYPNLSVLPASHSLDFALSLQGLESLAEKLGALADFVLIDCPAGVENGFYRSIACATEAIVVTTPHISCVRDAGKVLSVLRSRFDQVNLIVNRARGDLMLAGRMMSVDEIVSLLSVSLVGVIPEDDALSLSQTSGSEVSRGIASDALELAVQNLLRNENYIYDCTRRYRGLFGSVRRNLRNIV